MYTVSSLNSALCWLVFIFPFKYTPITEDGNRLAELPRWHTLTNDQKKAAILNLFSVYNPEGEKWNHVPLTSSHKSKFPAWTNTTSFQDDPV